MNRKRRWIILTAGVLLLLGGNVPASAQLEPVMQALRNGEITRQQAFEDVIQYGYTGTTSHTHMSENGKPVKCMVPWYLEFQSEWEDMVANAMEPAFVLSDSVLFDMEYLSAGGRFVLRYDTTGIHAVPLADTTGTGIPDYIERAAHYAETSWDLMVRQMGFVNPLMDSPYEIRFQNFAYYGTTSIAAPTTYMSLHHTFEGFPPNDDPEGNVLGALKATIAHELKHAIQYTTSRWRGNSGSTSWLEVDATMMEEVVFPQVNDYINYLSSVSIVRGPHITIPSIPPRPYDHASFGLYFYQTYGIRFWVQVWERIQQDNYLPMFDALQHMADFLNLDFTGEFTRMHLWHAASGSFSMPGYGFHDAALFPEPGFTPFISNGFPRNPVQVKPLQPLSGTTLNGYSGSFYLIRPSVSDTGQVLVALFRNHDKVHLGVQAKLKTGVIESFIPQPGTAETYVLGATPWQWEDVSELRLVISNASPNRASAYFLTGNHDTVPVLVMGDVNQDGQVTTSDADFLLDFLTGTSGLSNNPLVRFKADLSASGTITPLDLSYVMEIIESGQNAPLGPQPEAFNSEPYVGKRSPGYTNPAYADIRLRTQSSENGDTLDVIVSVADASDYALRGLSFGIEVPDTFMLLNRVDPLDEAWTQTRGAFMQSEHQVNIVFSSVRPAEGDDILRLRFYPQVIDTIYLKINQLVLNDRHLEVLNDSLAVVLSPSGPIHTPYIAELPNRTTLNQNYPNPFNPSTTIRFTTGTTGLVRLVVYDVLGREVTVLMDQVVPAGTHRVNIDAGGLSTGVYLYRLYTSDGVLTRKMTLLK